MMAGMRLESMSVILLTADAEEPRGDSAQVRSMDESRRLKRSEVEAWTVHDLARLLSFSR